MSVLLVVRALVGLTFGVYLGASTGLSWESFFVVLADYLILDGLLAATIAGILMREGVGTQRGREMGIGVVFLVDAIGRTASGVAIHVWPGIPGFPVTAVMFVGVMAAGTAMIGVMEALLVAREEVAQHGRWHQTPQFMAGAVALASLLSAAFGLAAIVNLGSPDAVRSLISAFVTAAGAVMLAMAWSRHRMGRRRSAAIAAVVTAAQSTR